jgi:peptidoglycan/xylan/chitin deacetylase (PgdA/CDA1 family)
LYFGSVRFYKHIILLFLFLVIVTPYAVSVCLFTKNINLRNQIIDTQTNIQSNVLAVPIIPNEISSTILNVTESNEINMEFVREGLPYQQKYDDLYAERNSFINTSSDKKMAYLNFDDGPSELTLKILDILDKYNIKATFFVVYKDDEVSLSIYKEIVKRGHTIGMHSSSHVYKQIYSSVDSYLDDIDKLYKHLYNVTDIKPNIFRFPGGSINTYNMNIYQEIIAEMIRRGFVYYDWNVSSGDAIENAKKGSIIKNVENGCQNRNNVIILMHDSKYKKNTYEALPDIIKYLNNNNYNIEKLDNTVLPITFGYLE